MLALFSDGSTVRGRSGAGVVCSRMNSNWRCDKLRLPPRVRSSLEAELWGVLCALQIAEEELSSVWMDDWRDRIVTVMCDCTSALDWIVNLEGDKDLPYTAAELRVLADIRDQAQVLNQISCSVHLMWVPAHEGFWANELADRLARAGADLPLQGS